MGWRVGPKRGSRGRRVGRTRGSPRRKLRGVAFLDPMTRAALRVLDELDPETRAALPRGRWAAARVVADMLRADRHGGASGG
jgi:hypothetical protein